MIVLKVSTRCRIVVQAEFPKGHSMAGVKFADVDTLEEAQAITAAALTTGAVSVGIVAHYQPVAAAPTNVTDLADFRKKVRH